MREHLPAWLAKGEIKNISNSILAHMIDSGHRVDLSEGFKVIYKVPPDYLKFLGQSLRATADATEIWLRKPVL
ncbi:unnamed protein product [Dibothriocephalus latus]|uniref:Uncharacterized protein n=1 Tax=Dibothriocephalus latus TaxID=60516 RepID=A0A3P7LM27_DIBLA|nr:unnamed protein product [Dibothriocephalus latus]